MVIEKQGTTDREVLMSVLATRPGLSGGFGVSWSLVAMVAGYIIQGIGLGKSVYDAVSGAGEEIPAGQQLRQDDVDAVANELQQRFPTTSKQSWTSLINEALAGKVEAPTAPAEACPAGFYRDPVTGACLEMEKKFEMPMWGWAAVAVGGIVFLPTILSMLRPATGMSAMSGLWGAGCRDKEGKFVPVPQCTGRRPKARE